MQNKERVILKSVQVTSILLLFARQLLGINCLNIQINEF